MIISIRDRCCCGFTAQNFTKKTIHWLEVVNLRQHKNLFNMGEKWLFRNFILLILWAINFIILKELASPLLMILPGSNSHLFKFPFRHSWQEERFSFPIIWPSGKKAIMCNFSHCKILNSFIGCFPVSARWYSEITLYTQFGLSRCFCSIHLSYIIEKKNFCDDTFLEKPFYPETVRRINQPSAVSWNTIMQNYSLIVLFG